MTPRDPSPVHRRMNRFLWTGAGKVEGWLHPLCARAVVAIAEVQAQLGIEGAIGEIGVYAGRLFILLKLSGEEGEPSFAIDLFESGEPSDGGPKAGSREAFLANVARWTGSARGVLALAQPSQTVKAAALLDACGLARLISVDGEHSQATVLNDLRLAEAVAAPHAAVLVDDYFNPDWPDVALGTARYLADPSSVLRPFAITPNKLMLARSEMHAQYREAMVEILRSQHVKTTTMAGGPVEVFTRRPRKFGLLG